MYTFTDNGVRVTCGACHTLTPVHTTTRIKVGTPPSFSMIETGRWDWGKGQPEMRLVKFPRTRTADACPACVDALARQRRAGGYDFLIERPMPAAIATHSTPKMPRLVKHRKDGTP